MSTKVVVRYNGISYYLANLSLNPNDGSLYLSFPRKGVGLNYSYEESPSEGYRLINKESGKTKTKSISYHATGRVNYKLGDNQEYVIYSEALFNISRPFAFYHISIPKLSSLDKYEGDIKMVNVVDVVQESDRRIDIGVVLTPNNYKNENLAGFGIRFDGLCDVVFVLDTIKIAPPAEFPDAYIYAHRQTGLFSTQQFSEEESPILFHQKLAGVKDVIIYRPNREGVYKVYFAVPMRIPPKLTVHFEDEGLVAEIVENRFYTTTTLSFKVKGRGGYIKEPRVIKYVELDAEL